MRQSIAEQRVPQAGGGRKAILQVIARHPAFGLKGEAALFALLVLLHVTPVWAFPYLPTQDGPSHVSNALILKDYYREGTRYREFFTIRQEPLPNLTSHLLLASLLHVLPPLIAEKALVSLYIIGFAWSFRYFVASLGADRIGLAPVALLFLFPRCFWMGFYNYGLGLVLFWITVGYCLRHRKQFGPKSLTTLAVLFTAGYFTHLVSFVLTVVSATWIVAIGSLYRVRNLAILVLATLPADGLTLNFLIGTGFIGSPASINVGKEIVHEEASVGLLEWADVELASFNRQLFETYEGLVPFGLLVLLFVEAMILASVAMAIASPEQRNSSMRRWPTVLLGLVLATLFVVVPDGFGRHGGYMKARLAVLVPLLCLACLSLPSVRFVRRALFTVMYLLIIVNLALVGRHVANANQELAEFTAGINSVGRNHTLVAIGTRTDRLADHLWHAADYYCLETGNINLDNYEAASQNFPVQFRAGMERVLPVDWAFALAARVDLILAWDEPFAVLTVNAKDYYVVFQRGRLRILAKR
jgi:MFS family permease